jgi:ATP-dependent Zn protease
VRALLDEAYERARETLACRESVLARLVAALLEREEVSGAEIQEMMESCSEAPQSETA